jgi:hypothetical protein
MGLSVSCHSLTVRPVYDPEAQARRELTAERAGSKTGRTGLRPNGVHDGGLNPRSYEGDFFYASKEMGISICRAF